MIAIGGLQDYRGAHHYRLRISQHCARSTLRSAPRHTVNFADLFLSSVPRAVFLREPYASIVNGRAVR
jgi:hypothetical protein